MSRWFGRISGFFRSRTLLGIDRAGNKYYTRKEEVDGILKEKRWVDFKGEEDSTSIPVEWICWLNGQRKKAPTPEEMVELEAKRERVKLNVARLKKEEEERKSREHSSRASTSKVGAPDLKSFIRQFPSTSAEGVWCSSKEISTKTLTKAKVLGVENDKESATADADASKFRKPEEFRERKPSPETQPVSSEPTGSGQSFKPGTWQPPT
ncbi:hypothetical protein Scep_028783 [Stephania cephalantha]|uniref:NADH dehydrogenase [ubiquinone] 1 alpha subcomplex subunit 12 n=1 Tax=Stephania cephalantha TaxID=152367 RepID=A0AAP0HME8_9MAGN